MEGLGKSKNKRNVLSHHTVKNPTLEQPSSCRGGPLKGEEKSITRFQDCQPIQHSIRGTGFPACGTARAWFSARLETRLTCVQTGRDWGSRLETFLVLFGKLAWWTGEHRVRPYG
jgi:hypothetical protein